MLAMVVKTLRKWFGFFGPARFIGERLLPGIRQMKRGRSAVQEHALRGAPIAADTRRDYRAGMKSRSLNVRAELARVSVGRMFLHVACALKDGRMQWHWEGIKRELAEPCRNWRAR
jgi:hypothetical protein